MFGKQLLGGAGALAAAVTLALLWRYREMFAGAGPESGDAAGWLAYVLSWLVLPGLSLLIGVVGAGRR